MNATSSITKSSTFSELASFLTVLNKREIMQQLGSQKRTSFETLAMHLEMQLPKNPQPAIFRRLGKHTQLTLQFGN
jgi:hypothetical protein